MVTKKIAGHKVTHFDSLDLPYNRFMRFNAFILIDSAAAPEANSIINRLAVLDAKIREGKYNEALIESANIRQAAAFAVANISPKMLAFAALVTEIDGVPKNDLSDSGLQQITELLSKEDHSVLIQIVESVKKKINQEYRAINGHSDAQEIAFYQIVREYIGSIRDSISLGKKIETDYESKLLAFGKPIILHGSEGVESEAEKEHAVLKLIFSRDYSLDLDNTPMNQVLRILKIIKENKK